MSSESPKNGESGGCGHRSDLVEMSVDEMLAVQTPSEAIRAAAREIWKESKCRTCPTRTQCNSRQLLFVISSLKRALEAFEETAKEVSIGEDTLFQVSEATSDLLEAVIGQARPGIRAMEELCRELYKSIEQ